MGSPKKKESFTIELLTCFQNKMKFPIKDRKTTKEKKKKFPIKDKKKTKEKKQNSLSKIGRKQKKIYRKVFGPDSM